MQVYAVKTKACKSNLLTQGYQPLGLFIHPVRPCVLKFGFSCALILQFLASRCPIRRD
jgi:hypothetical protein